LVVEKSRVPGGGIMMNLQGRFQNAMTVSVDAKGNTSSLCVPAASEPAGKSGGVK
jgi:hypothetical protein